MSLSRSVGMTSVPLQPRAKAKRGNLFWNASMPIDASDTSDISLVKRTSDCHCEEQSDVAISL